MRRRWEAVRVVAGNRNLLALLMGFGGWMVGDWAVLILLSVVAYERGGVAAVGVIGAVRVLPTAIFAPLGSWVADRVSRPRLLVAVQACWFVLMLAAAFVTAADVPLGVLYAVLAAAAVVASAFRGTINALIPQVVDTAEELSSANAVYSLVEGVSALLGPALAGVLLARASPAAGLAVVSVVYAGSALVTLAIRTETQPARTPADARRWRELLAGLRALVERRQQGSVYFLMMAQCLMRGLLMVYVVTASLTVFGLGEAGAGQLFAAMGVGGLLGAAASFGVGARRAALPFTVGIVLWGLPVLLMAVFPDAAVAWIALAAVGFGNALEDVFGLTILNRYLPDHLAGRAFGIFWGTAAGAVAVGSLLAPVLIEILGLRGAMAVSGLVLTAAAVAVWGFLRGVDTAPGVSAEQVELLRGLSVFAPLSHVVLERLVRASREETFPAGRVVVRQGEPGDAFYVVAEGRLAVAVDGRRTRDLGPGDGFGEIALVQVRRRTATVTAVDFVRLLRLDAPTFVSAVTGHRGAEAATITLARRRFDAAHPQADMDE
jgi:MFS family permease